MCCRQFTPNVQAVWSDTMLMGSFQRCKHDSIHSLFASLITIQPPFHYELKQVWWDAKHLRKNLSPYTEAMGGLCVLKENKMFLRHCMCLCKPNASMPIFVAKWRLCDYILLFLQCFSALTVLLLMTQILAYTARRVLLLPLGLGLGLRCG